MWQVHDQELGVIVAAFEEWQAWLVGTNEAVLVFLDHANLQYFMKSQKLTPRQAHWAAYLSPFSFHILHTPAKTNPADPASRLPDSEQGRVAHPLITLLKPALLKGGISVCALTILVSSLNIEFVVPTSGTRDLISSAYATNPVVSQVPVPPFYYFRGGLWWYQDHIYVPLSLRVKILGAYHNYPAMGHPGIARMLSCLSQTYSWRSMRADVMQFVSTCKN